MFISRFSLTLLGAATVSLFMGTANSLRAESAQSPTVVELFTSQGCYSCPPAEAYLGKLSKRPDVVALEFHVDYWDDLVYGSAGKWKDPFSAPEHTRRQRLYNVEIRGKAGVYTPQMVIGGNLETVGSQENRVEKAISLMAGEVPSPLSVRVENGNAGTLNVRIVGRSAETAGIWIVRFHRNVKTRVRSGENKGKSLTSHNIVTNLQKIGEWQGEPLSISVTDSVVDTNQGCAILVQKVPPGPILGAAYCPGGSSS